MRNITKIAFAIFAFTSIFAIGMLSVETEEISADDTGNAGINATYSYDQVTKELIISGTGEMENWTSSLEVPWSSYCNDINSVVVGNGITSIGNHAFYNCSSLAGISIPDGVTSIGSSAFYNCSSLAGISIPDGVTSIGSSAFHWCKSIESLIIPDSVSSIGIFAFFGCSGLTSLTIPIDIDILMSGRFTSLISLTLTKGQTGIGPSYYSDYEPFTPWTRSDLSFVIISDGVISIGDCMFYGSLSLTCVSIPDSVTSIGYGAFHGCSSLTKINIPGNVTNIDRNAFYGCSSLTNIEVGADSENYSSIGGVLYNKNMSILLRCPMGRAGVVDMPDSVTEVSDYAFYNCSLLTQISIGKNVAKIGNLAFSGCSSLTSITVPGSVNIIGNQAFYGCSLMECIQFEGDAPAIGNYLFSGDVRICHKDSAIGFDSLPWDGMDVISVTTPGAITDLIATVTGPGGIQLEWSAPSNNGGGLTLYSIWYKTANSDWILYDTIDIRSITVTNLDQDTLYTFYVTTENIAGTSDSNQTSAEIRSASTSNTSISDTSSPDNTTTYVGIGATVIVLLIVATIAMNRIR